MKETLPTWLFLIGALVFAAGNIVALVNYYRGT